MKQATFFELAHSDASPFEAMLDKALELVTDYYQNRRWVTVLCASQKEAEHFDELLWQRPADRFIAHNLLGEGPQNGSPVEIAWLGKPVRPRNILINLSQKLNDDQARAQLVIDFVPSHDDAKQQARERYKQLKQTGRQMQFVTLA